MENNLFSNGGCDCPACRANRQNQEYKFLRNLSPSEQEDMQSMLAEQALLTRDFKKLDTRKDILMSRLNMFWGKLRLEFNADMGELSVDDDIKHLKRAIKVEEGC